MSSRAGLGGEAEDRLAGTYVPGYVLVQVHVLVQVQRRGRGGVESAETASVTSNARGRGAHTTAGEPPALRLIHNEYAATGVGQSALLR